MNKDNPQISVVIPTYNRSELLHKSIQSVLNQDYQDFEIIVVDDCSIDDVKSSIATFKDPRIKYIRHDKNRGEGASRNTGIGIARGQYIASHDDDDEWLPTKLTKQINAFAESPPPVGVVYTGLWRIYNQEKKIYVPSDNIGRKEGNIHHQLLQENFVPTPTTLIKKECFAKAGLFDENLRNLVDWELWIRLSKYYEFRYLEEPLVISYLRPDSVTVNQDSRIKAFELILEKHLQEFLKEGFWRVCCLRKLRRDFLTALSFA